jgi:hypothetical protein
MASPKARRKTVNADPQKLFIPHFAVDCKTLPVPLENIINFAV